MSKSSGYIESIIPAKLRALFQWMQPKPRNEYSPPPSPLQNNNVKTSAVIFSGTKRDTSPLQSSQSVPVSKPAMAKSPKQKINQHVKWTNPQVNTILSPPPMKWTNPQVDNIFSPALVSGHARSQSDMQHLLWSHPRIENIGSPLFRTKKVYGHQSPKTRSPQQQHMRSPQCTSHRCSKPHCFYQHIDCACEKCSNPQEFQRILHVEDTNQNQIKQSQPRQCSHQCQHHHRHKHSSCHHNQGVVSLSLIYDLMMPILEIHKIISLIGASYCRENV